MKKLIRKIRGFKLKLHRKKGIKKFITFQTGGVFFLSLFLITLLSFIAYKEDLGINSGLIFIISFVLLFYVVKLLNRILRLPSIFFLESIFYIGITIYILKEFLDYSNPISDSFLYLYSVIYVVSLYMFGGLIKIIKNTKKNTVILLLLSVVFIAFPLYTTIFTLSRGTKNNIIQTYFTQDKYFKLAESDEENNDVKWFYYGSGENWYRSVYGKNVDYITETIDCEKYLEEEDKTFEFFLEKVFNINKKSIPLNGLVAYNATMNEGEKYNLVIIVHGMHDIFEQSDEGYKYLQLELAKDGFIAVSIDETFLNAGTFGKYDDEEDLRAILILEQIKELEKMNNDEESILFNKIEFSNITLMGHSRGGEAVFTAAYINNLSYLDDIEEKLEYNFDIKNIIAIAPTDKRYKPNGITPRLKNVNYLCIQGANDSDVGTYKGYVMSNRIAYTTSDFYINTTLYVYGANHSQFNSTWGSLDTSAPFKGLMVNSKPIMKSIYQRELLTKMITKFLGVCVKGEISDVDYFYNLNDKYIDEFYNTRYIQTYTDSNHISLYAFSSASYKVEETDNVYIDETYTKNEIKRYDKALYIKSDEEVQWLETKFDFIEYSKLFINIASLDLDKEQVYHIELKDKNDNIVISQKREIFRVIPVQLMKWELYDELRFHDKYESCFETFCFTKDEFSVNVDFDFQNVVSFKIEFDDFGEGVILDDIEIGK